MIAKSAPLRALAISLPLTHVRKRKFYPAAVLVGRYVAARSSRRK